MHTPGERRAVVSDAIGTDIHAGAGTLRAGDEHCMATSPTPESGATDFVAGPVDAIALNRTS